MYNGTLRCLVVTIVAVEKSITHSECVFVNLVIRYKKRMRRSIVIRGLSGSTIFSKKNSKIFGEKVIEIGVF